MTRINRIVVLLFTGWLISPYIYADTLYVYSLSIPLYSQPSFSALVLTTVYRGTALKIKPSINSNQPWQAVDYHNHSGWIPAAAMGIVPPRKKIPQSDLANYFDQSKHAVADYRRRISDHSHTLPASDGASAVTPAARDDKALQLMETLQVSDDELARFRAELNNTP